MPFMITWFLIWYVFRLLFELFAAFNLLLYNIWLYFVALAIILFQISLKYIVWNDDVTWVFFDNFYSGLQAMATDYDEYISIYPGTYFIWLLFWPLIYTSQYLYYIFT